MQRNIPSLDGLRAISILFVIVSHLSVNVYHDYAAGFTRIESIIQTLFLVGHLGVTIFFVISGFLITTLLLREEEIDLKKFYFRRTLRIFPPYYFYLLVILIASLFGVIALSNYNFFSALFYVRNYFFDDAAPGAWFLAHTWSLSVEEQFYLILPATLLLLNKKRGFVAVVLAILLCPLIRFLYVWNDPSMSIEFGRFETVADALAVGCLLAGTREWLHRQPIYERLIRSNLLLVAPFIALAITWLGFFPKYYPKPLYVLIAITVQNISIALFLDWAVTNFDGKIGRLLNARPVAFVGLISYSIYLWQQPFLNPELAWPIPLKLLCVVLASLGSYYLIEKPSLRFRHFLEKRFGAERKPFAEPFVEGNPVREPNP